MIQNFLQLDTDKKEVIVYGAKEEQLKTTNQAWDLGL